MRLKLVGAVPALAIAIASAGQAQSIDPATFSGSLDVGESITIHKTITLGEAGADLVDVFFLADNTGSMGGTIGQAQSGASAILGALPAGTNVGVGSYQGDCAEGGLPAGCDAGSTIYYGTLINTPLTSSLSDAQDGINDWFAGYGGDYPEAGFDALRVVAEGTSWRTGSKRLVVWFGDAPSHTESTTMAGAISALNGVGATVLAFNNTSAGNGLDGSYGADASQASTIATATGGSLTNNFLSLTGSDFVNAINGAISSATTSLDLNFGTSYSGGGLSFAFVCTDALGCDDVGPGEARTFDVTITALAAGTYDFSVFADGVAATELDHLVVGGPVTAIPEPSSWALVATGLVMVGFGGYRRRTK